MFITSGRQGQFPKEMPSSILMRRWFYKVYNWTPEEVDNIPLEELIWLPIIEGADAEAHDYKIRQSQKSTSSSPPRSRPIQGF